MSEAGPDVTALLAQKGYRLINTIGHGASAVIYLVYSERYATNFALKHINLTKLTVCKRCELEALQTLNSSNVIQLYDFEIQRNSIFLFLEYCPRGTLNDFIEKSGPLTGRKLVAVTKTLISGLAFIHSKRIAHGDIKPQNCLIDRYGRVKYADFGYSRAFGHSTHSTMHAGSIGYMSPEVLSRGPFDPFLADMWALGVMIYFVSVGKTPWDGETDPMVVARTIVSHARSGGHVDVQAVPTDVRALCARLLRRVDERPTCQQLLNEPMFQGVDVKEGYLAEVRAAQRKRGGIMSKHPKSFDARRTPMAMSVKASPSERMGFKTDGKMSTEALEQMAFLTS